MTSRTSNRKQAPQRGFTLIELVVAGTIAAFVLTAVTFALSQLSKGRNIARDRVEAFQRGSTALEALRREVSSTIRSDDLFETRFLLTTREASARTGGHERSDLLLFNTSMRPTRTVEYQGEGREYETQFRVEDDELGSAIWRRRDYMPDETPDGGGTAEPLADGVVGFLVEASDGDAGWRTEWDSDVDGLPKLVRMTVVSTGVPLGGEPNSMSAEVTLRTVVAIDRVIGPKEDPPPEEQAPTTDGSGGATAQNGGTGAQGNGAAGGRGGGGGAAAAGDAGGAAGDAAGGGATQNAGGGRGQGGRGGGGGGMPPSGRGGGGFPGGGTGGGRGGRGGGGFNGGVGGGAGGRGGQG
jgi:prepilin-type N-terminal cleavage/methylation domain-containing protein